MQGNELLIGLMGDEDTVTGFLLAGVGEKLRGKQNFFVVNDQTSTPEIEEAFTQLTAREDIGMLILNQHIANEIRHKISTYEKLLPVLVEIPSKHQEYDARNDEIMIKVARMLGRKVEM